MFEFFWDVFALDSVDGAGLTLESRVHHGEHYANAFWNGVVLYREKRWAEAYTEFQKARGPDGDEDAPLQLYLRRLETLALHLTTAPE